MAEKKKKKMREVKGGKKREKSQPGIFQFITLSRTRPRQSSSSFCVFPLRQ